jgi:hypothetical protein
MTTNKLQFRAWDSDKKKMYYSNSSFFIFGPGGFFIAKHDYKPKDKSKLITNISFLIPMAYLNYHDKNGKEICSCDILKNEFGRMLVICKEGDVFFREQSTKLEIPAMFIDFSKIEIIGNLYEHPYLIS